MDVLNLGCGHWHISEQFFESVGRLALRLLGQGQPLDSLISEHPERSFLSGLHHADQQNFSFKTVVNDAGEQAALIPLYGTMTKYGGFCSYGTAELAAMINEANRNQDRIKGIVLDIDSPGGSGDSVEVLSRAIDASELPMVASVDRLAASAAQWVASSVASNGGKILVDSLDNSMMGSIGSFIIHQNIAARLSNNGVKMEIIRAPQSTDKARFNNIEELTDELRTQLKEDLRQHTNRFIDAIKSNYGESLKTDTDKLFTGGTFYGKEAIEIGLAHEQGDLSQAFNQVFDMAATRSKKSFFISNMNMFKRLGLSFSIAHKLSAEELKSLTEAADKLAQVDALQAENAQLTEQNGTLTQQVAELTQERDTIQQENTELTSQNETLQADLDQKPAAAATTAVTEEDKGADENTNKYETSADRELAEMKGKLNVVK